MADKTLRLILGDQLNCKHSWFETTDHSITYVIMEIRIETDYTTHHIQKIAGFFAAMRHFSNFLESKKHQCIYLNINDKDNLQSLEANLSFLIQRDHYTKFEYQLPDEYRVDLILKKFTSQLAIASKVYDTEHFFSTRDELAKFFEGKKTFLMESFYRAMRKKHQVLMSGDNPMTGQWNYDEENRKKLPKNHKPTAPLVFTNNVSDIMDAIVQTDIKTMGVIDKTNFIWPVNRDQSLELLAYFTTECLPLFGTYQDAMIPDEWSLYHSRLSFSLNTKMIAPAEVIEAAIAAWQKEPERIAYNQLEGFVRQIIGWREYMRGIYWLKMPEYATLNFFNHKEKLPDWYWTGKTKMNCLKDAITQSLTFAYAHHIQRLMITGNFALLAGTDPDEVDAWYLGIYIDALDWVEITNTRGMSQFADGGIVGTKPYVSSAAYIDKMSHYCGTCFYNKAKKTGDRACPFNSLYWNFYDKQEAKLAHNPRIGMMYKVWHKMKPEDQTALLEQANYYLKNINEL
ncbi:MAG: cryptochrome/photolyase family protein [Flavobacterium circumlabens]|uniref:cryptochrome/photolyase family protein n=1 Tax=Flavobacterium circumlabens TaxID=2133765 RepID=UPI00326698ED